MAINQFQKHRTSADIISDLFSSADRTIFIHYSCESFYDIVDGRSPRITSIALRFLRSGQTRSFSLHKEAELANLDLQDFSAQIDNLEESMLKKFYDQVEKLEERVWVHWNMRDSNYGFEAIAHRFRVLGGSPVDIPDGQKVDLARVMYDFLGPDYVGHPRFHNLLEFNNMVPRNFLTGAEEAEAFNNGEYVKLHQSTLSKVDAIMDIAAAANEGRLKSQNGYFKTRGLNFSTAAVLIKDHPIFVAISIIAVLLALTLNVLRFFNLF
ncbi:hypothetical protein [Parvularcula marina]|nr:hypothetical protein [Parvularcula marina]